MPSERLPHKARGGVVAVARSFAGGLPQVVADEVDARIAEQDDELRRLGCWAAVDKAVGRLPHPLSGLFQRSQS